VRFIPPEISGAYKILHPASAAYKRKEEPRPHLGFLQPKKSLFDPESSISSGGKIPIIFRIAHKDVDKDTN
jgi:hypothetical protein